MTKTEFRIVHVNTTKESIESKFSRRLYHLSAEQNALNESMSNMAEYDYVGMYVCTKAEYTDPAMDEEVRKTLQNHRSMISCSVKENNYPKIAGTNRYAYQTVVSLEDDNCYWLLVRRLSPMGNNSNR
jgi:hypothetical protein